MRLRGTIGVVTGASSGIGRAVALDLARQGVHLALVARDAVALGEVATLAAAHGVRTLVVPLDVADAAAVAAGCARIREQLGEPDLLVNAAGFAVWKPFLDVDVDEHRQMMDVNYWGTFHCLRELLPGMRARGRGGIVNVSAGTGTFALAVTSGFSASKFAVRGLSEALYRELRGSGVQVSCLHPGSVRTPFWDDGRIPPAGLPAIVRYAPKLSPAAVARQVRYCLWFGFPVRTIPIFVAFLARLDAIWVRLADLVLWKWFVPAALALVGLRLVARRLGVL